MYVVTDEMIVITTELDRQRSLKRPNGTKIHYLEKRLERLKQKDPPILRSKSSPRTTQRRKTSSPNFPRSYIRSRAYVLSLESQDLTRAIEALQDMQKEERVRARPE